MAPRSQHKHRYLVPGLIVLALAVKVFLCLMLADVFFYGEELEKGAAGKAMLDGLPIEHHKLAYHYYEGGGFVISHLKAFCFWLVGPSYLANKLVALTSIAAVLWTVLMLARRAFSERVMLWTGLLFVFAPPSFQKLPLISLGIHFEACFFLFCMFDLTLGIAYRNEQRWRSFFLLGLVTGLGVYFSYQLAPAALYCALVMAWKRPRTIFGPRGLTGLAGFLVGLAPLLWMFSLVGDAIFDIHGTTLVGGTDFDRNSLKLREFLLSIYTERPALELVSPILYPAVIVLAAVVLYFDREQDRLRERGPVLFLVGFALFWLCVYVTSSFVHGKVWYYYYLHRFTPLWLVTTVVVAAWISRLRESHDPFTARFGLIVGSGLVLLGGAYTFQVAAEGRPTHLSDNWSILTGTKGYRYSSYFAKLKNHMPGTLEERLDVVSAYDEDPRLLYPEIALEFLAPGELRNDGDPKLGELLARLEAWDAEAAPHLMRGLGPWIQSRTGVDVAAALRAVEGLEERHRRPLREAIGRWGEGFLRAVGWEEQLSREARAALEAPGREDYWFGMGERVYDFHRIRPEAAEAFIETLPEEARPALHRGYRHAHDLRQLP